MQIHLPWPPTQLWPNRRCHWRKKAAVAAQYKRDCAYMVPKTGKIFSDGKIPITIVFRPPNRIRRDVDNMLAAIKQGLDALAEKLGVDDSRFRLTLDIGEPVKGGRVCVSISEAAP